MNALRRIHLGRVRLVLPVVATLLAILACGPAPSTPTPPFQLGTMAVSTTEPPTAPPPPTASEGEDECSHDYFPSDLGTTWEFVGTNSMLGGYQNTVAITVSADDGFIVSHELLDGSGTLLLAYSCTDEGLTLLDPFGQSSAAVVATSEGSATVTTLAQSGLTVPADLEGASTWQQYVEWEAQGGDGTALRGETTFNYVSRGVEVVTVPFGTFEAIRIDIEVRTTMKGQEVMACQNTTWVAADVGTIKGEQSCGGIDDSMELLSFDSP